MIVGGLPTLLRKGFVIPPKGMSENDKKKLENTIAIDYILEIVNNRIPQKKGSKAKIAAKKYGEKVIVLKSQTGSGKSTALPAKLYTSFFERTKKNIAVTQPRILTAMDIPSKIVKNVPELQLDKNIGYNTGSFKRIPKEKGVIFSTIGIISQQLIMNTDEEFMKKYQFIIIDEVHERDIETDLCLFLLKKLIQTNYADPECPMIILASATFNEKIFMRYFDVPEQNYIQVQGSTFAIEEHFPDYSVANYILYATLKAQKLHIDNLEDITPDNSFRDIIIFVKDTGIGKKIYESMHLFNAQVLDNSLEEILKYSAELEHNIDSLYKKGGVDEATGGGEKDGEKKHYYILPILLDKTNFEKGGLEYQNLFSRIDTINVPMWKLDSKRGIDTTATPYKYVSPSRRIIIATNIAETGVTIDSLKYCVDTGYHFNVEFNPEMGCPVMYSKNVTRGMAVQRRGRVGRESPGVWYPCYTKATFDAMPEEQFSKILISDVTDNLLGILIKEKNVEILEEESVNKIKNHNEENLFQTFSLTSNTWYKLQNLIQTNLSALDFIEMPSMQSLSYSIEKLHILGFIDDNYDVTVPGFYANKIRFISLELRKMILAGYCYGANILDLITISAFVYITKRRVFGKKFKMLNFLKKSDIEFEFYNRILFGDDFINSVFVWNIFQSFIQKSLSNLDNDILRAINNVDTTEYKQILYNEKIKEWCVENDLLYDGLLNVIAIRDQIIENIITLGLNPYRNSLSLPKNAYNLNKILIASLSDGIEEIKKIKQSIYEGFKCNILIKRKRMYMSLLRNVNVKVSSAFVEPLDENKTEQQKPLYIIVDSYTLKQKMGQAQFEFLADGFVSVLDNFIDVDEGFFIR